MISGSSISGGRRVPPRDAAAAGQREQASTARALDLHAPGGVHQPARPSPRALNPTPALDVAGSVARVGDRSRGPGSAADPVTGGSAAEPDTT